MNSFGASQKLRQQRLGHAEGSPVTETIYTHVISEDGKRIAAQLGKAVWGVLDPSWTPTGWGEPLRWHSFFLDTASAFLKAFLHLLAGEGVWGRGRHLSPLPQQSCINLCAVLFVLKEHHRRASRFGLGFGLLLEFFGGSIAQRRVQPLPIVVLVDELFDVRS